MEGPPRRSSSRPAANVNCCYDDDKRSELGVFKEYLAKDNSTVIDPPAHRKTPNDIDLKAVIYENDDLISNIYEKAAMDGIYGGNAVNSIYDIEAGQAPNIYGIYTPSYDFHGSAGVDHEYIHIGNLTDNEAAVNKDNTEDDNVHADNTTTPLKEMMDIRTQALQHVDDAKAVYQQLKASVKDANDMLGRMNKKNQQISDDLLSEIEICLTDTPGWFFDVLEEKNRSIDALQQICQELRSKHDESLEPMGLSAGDQKKLRSVGVENLADLITNYRRLQIQSAGAAERRGGQSLSRASSKSSLDTTEECQQQKHPQAKLLEPGRLSSSFANVGTMGNSGRASYIPIPMPDKFTGKSRIELERYLRYFDQAVLSRGYPDSDKAIIVGNYIPSLQYTHDKLMRTKSSYDEVKAGLLNALGTDSDVATFTLRTSLDRIKNI
uniref:Uncharacterized protein n=1 Tax=Panagrolaimus superbus TaxID=310955 RepID=A0A914XWT7_9BILA